MGIILREILEMDYFKNFEVIAGKGGINKEVQGITAMEAPDCFRWAVGKELVLSSGYVIKQEPECLMRAYQEGDLTKISGLMVKMERYIKEIPKEILDIFNENNLPLIKMPDSIPWMELITQVTTQVMNRSIQGMEIYRNPGKNIIDKTYKEQKILRVLSMAEKDMGYPAMLYDLDEEKAYYSSKNFIDASRHYELSEADYWNPTRGHKRVVLCDYINMDRIRLDNPDGEEGPRVSWITVPIVAEKTIRAYFVVMESRDFLDYYDDLAIRMTFLMLHSMYEQINAVNSAGNIGFENFILFALNYSEPDKTRLIYQAGVQGVSLNTSYVMALMSLNNESLHFRNDRKLLVEVFEKSGLSKNGHIVVLDQEVAIILFEQKSGSEYTFEQIEGFLKKYENTLKQRVDDADICFGVSMEPKLVEGLQSSFEKCKKTLSQGRFIFPSKNIWEYNSLGPFAWMEVPPDELEGMLATFRALGDSEKNRDLLYTLKTYLENNMNYSITADKLFVHINTIRKRIQKLNDSLQINLDDPIERMKLEILLQYMQL